MRPEDDDVIESVGLLAEEGQPVTRGNPQSNYGSRPMTQEQIEAAELAKDMKYGAEQVVTLVKPVSITMMVVVATIRSVTVFAGSEQSGSQFLYAPVSESSDESTSSRVGAGAINAIIIIGVIVLMTFFLVTLYKYRCYRAIHGWLIFSSLLLLFFFTYYWLAAVLVAANACMDWITMVILIWNVGVAGMLAIHWKGPLRVRQAYLVVMSSLMALVLIQNLPEYTTWILLGLIACWDLVAVLCPGGPLKQLVETAQERDEEIFPALIYSSTVIYLLGMADKSRVNGDRDISNFGPSQPTAGMPNTQRGATPTPIDHSHRDVMRAPGEDEDETGVKLGLGDFIFYSVLVGRAAATGDWGTIAACYISIIIGLTCTLFILSIYQKALPALPISIFFGLIFYFTTANAIMPMLESTMANGAFM